MPDIHIVQKILIDAAQTCLPGAGKAIEVMQKAKPDGSLVTDVDADLQRVIDEGLKACWPHIPLLGEEMAHEDQKRMLGYSDQGLWILDPLDGTTNFAVGFPMYGLSLAYVKNGKTQLAVIYDPNRKECFTAERGEGAYLNGVRLYPGRIDRLNDCVANVDYKRLTGVLADRLVSCPPYRSQRNMGSCVLEWCWLAANRIQLYLHGGQHLWDHAAGHLILSESGGTASRLDGQPLISDKLVKQSALAACSPALFENWFEWVKLHSNLN
ncbi:MAG: inositol monophosphatase family protein [Proteobacteria bacterium]|nr:inositol monophosphatase family protein [Pseudomonadota bacterium]